MPKITIIKGTGIVIRGNDIDTDRIIPARYMKEVTFAGMGKYPFFDERFDENGNRKAHPFNDERFQGASILVVNKNFGCGSSREHAPQALMRWGIKTIVGESFAEIFAGNCTMMGVPTITLPKEEIDELMDFIEENPNHEIVVDLTNNEISYAEDKATFSMKGSSRKALMEGTWDSTRLLLEAREEIESVAGKLPYLTF
ncbi:3-isopropylmalate dehydratase small subunit [Candidatus Woesearchaeota archaeon]|nr:3-isopropylmalate dehydratase small subunit [Candidatus Woesearchaeota archaeon]